MRQKKKSFKFLSRKNKPEPGTGESDLKETAVALPGPETGTALPVKPRQLYFRIARGRTLDPSQPDSLELAPDQVHPEKEKNFYSEVLDETERGDFADAARIEGIDDEITMFRVEIKSLLEEEPRNLSQIIAATNTLARLVKTRYSITGKQKKGLKEAIEKVFKDIALPLGIEIMKKKL